jgi:hypothetical protein
LPGKALKWTYLRESRHDHSRRRPDLSSPFFGKTVATLHITDAQGTCRAELTNDGRALLAMSRAMDRMDPDRPDGQFALFSPTRPVTEEDDAVVEAESVAFFRIDGAATLHVEKTPGLPVGSHSLLATHYFPRGTRPAETARLTARRLGRQGRM